MVENIKLYKYDKPTPVQSYAIPAILQGHDLLSCARTGKKKEKKKPNATPPLVVTMVCSCKYSATIGSGKTAAFLIPILSKLMGKAKVLAAPRPIAGTFRPNIRSFVSEPLVVIMAPTRELAVQIFDACRRFCYRSMLRPCVVYGGADNVTQRLELEKGCDVLVATPGRLYDFLSRRRVLNLRRVKYLVIDEADQMLAMGFEPQVRNIIEATSLCQDDDRQIMMFSATFKKEIRTLAGDFLADNYVRVKIGRTGSTHSNITQTIKWVDERSKPDAIFNLLYLAEVPARTLIFVNNKRTADTLDDFLYNRHLPITSIHSQRNQLEREDALIAFRSGRCPIMIATAIASRGLDIKDVMHVINYDLPNDIEEYIHRIGKSSPPPSPSLPFRALHIVYTCVGALTTSYYI